MASIHAKSYEHDYRGKQSKLDVFAFDLEEKLSEAIEDRAEVDERFIKDRRAYNGQYDLKVEDDLKEKKRSRAFLNMTKQKANAAKAQMLDLLSPNSGKIWGISPTPIPSVAKRLDDHSVASSNGVALKKEDGEMVTVADLAKKEMEIARQAANAMEKKIHDQLVESDFERHKAQVIHDGVVYGTGVIKAPVINGKMRTAYEKTEHGFALVVEQDLDAAVQAVRPWDFYPDMSAETIDQAEYTFERRYLSRRQVQKLVHIGADQEQIKDLLKMTATETQHKSVFSDAMRDWNKSGRDMRDTRYETWEYTGRLCKDALLELGAITEDDVDDPLKDYYGTAIMCGGYVVKAEPELLNGLEAQTYHVFNWETDDNCIFGYGIPYLMSQSQEQINAIWRMMLDNGAITAGPQIGYNPTKIEPADGDETLQPFKFWLMKGGAVDIKQAFSTFEFNSHLPELANLFSLARTFVDDESGVPMLQQGEQGMATQTLGGMSMLMNAANTVRRSQVRRFDRGITVPMITSFYHFNMQYDDDDSIKGDYDVDAKGTSALLVRETQAQAIFNLISIGSSNPIFMPLIQLKSREILEQWAKTQQLPESILPTKEELDEYFEKVRKQEEEGGNKPPEQTVAELKHQYAMELEKAKAQTAMVLKKADQELELYKAQSQENMAIRKERMEVYKLHETGRLKEAELANKLRQLEIKETAVMHRFNTEVELKNIFPSTGNYGLETH